MSGEMISRTLSRNNLTKCFSSIFLLNKTKIEPLKESVFFIISHFTKILLLFTEGNRSQRFPSFFYGKLLWLVIHHRQNGVRLIVRVIRSHSYTIIKKVLLMRLTNMLNCPTNYTYIHFYLWF